MSSCNTVTLPNDMYETLVLPDAGPTEETRGFIPHLTGHMGLKMTSARLGLEPAMQPSLQIVPLQKLTPSRDC